MSAESQLRMNREDQEEEPRIDPTCVPERFHLRAKALAFHLSKPYPPHRAADTHSCVLCVSAALNLRQLSSS